MAFQNQFALSLELTRLLPLKWATNTTANALMNRARELRHSGSDIVVEEDLAGIFGRCKISDSLGSSFRTVVTQSTSNISLLEGIMLQGGPGPTVVRAFKESPYFAMVVQLSFLVWAFEARFLATAITNALRNRAKGAPPGLELPITPDRQGILGVLRACESQTSAFNWNMMLNAVSVTLGYEAERAPIEFPGFVLQGLLDMFPMVQTLPSDRFIHIQIPVGERVDSGVSALVVWAHRILDLTVLVRRRGNKEGSIKNIRFGGMNVEQVFIEEVTVDDEASITMLDSQKEHLLKIKLEPDADDVLIGSIRRIPARGWGNYQLANDLEARSPAIIEDLQLITSAFAFMIAKHLVKDNRTLQELDEEDPEARASVLYDVDEQHLLRASKFLFDNSRISRRRIDSIVARYSATALNEDLPLPPALEAGMRSDPSASGNDDIAIKEWDIISRVARSLSILLLAVAHVDNLEDCEDLMFADYAFGHMGQHTLALQLEDWNGNDDLFVPDDAWMQALAIPLLDDAMKVPWEKVCLISNRGWSAWISTFGNLDPAYTRAGTVRLGRGSPCRNGVWKTGIWDATHGIFQYGDFCAPTHATRAEFCGHVASLRCAEKVSVESPYCGEGEDVFVVYAQLRFHTSIPHQRLVVRVGYKELHKNLWRARVSKSCSHGSRMHEGVKLGVGCATVAGFGYYLDELDERILIWLTANSVGARWLALLTLRGLAISDSNEVEEVALRQILLRADDCCLQCAIDQAAAKPGRWFIIL